MLLKNMITEIIQRDFSLFMERTIADFFSTQLYKQINYLPRKSFHIYIFIHTICQLLTQGISDSILENLNSKILELNSRFINFMFFMTSFGLRNCSHLCWKTNVLSLKVCLLSLFWYDFIRILSTPNTLRAEGNGRSSPSPVY